MSAHHSLDVIGDVEGHLAALENLAIELGYDITRGWRHAEGRIAVFLGGLIGSGHDNVEVAELVIELCRSGRALCLLGASEHDLVSRRLRLPGYDQPQERPPDPSLRERWDPVIDFFQELPMGIELPDLRILHGCWHRSSVERLRPVLGLEPGDDDDMQTPRWLRSRTTLRSPFTASGLVEGLPTETGDDVVGAPHEVLLKGPQVPTAIFYVDSDGHRRHDRYPLWWRDDEVEVLRDRTQVFGCYRQVPPILGHFAPAHPPGSHEHRKWLRQTALMVPHFGATPLVGDHACINFHALRRRERDLACVGALRWPERQIVWASAPATRRPLSVP